MARIAERKWLCLIVAAYLVFASSLPDTSLHAGKLSASDVFFTTISRTIDCLAEHTVIGDKVNRLISALRLLTPAEMYNTGACVAGVFFSAAVEYSVPAIKDSVKLNLRI
jgi:hypothetical protein